MNSGVNPDAADPSPRRSLLDALNRLSDAYEDGVPEDELLQEAGKDGHPLGSLEQAYEDLKRQGEVYVVPPDRVKPTRNPG